MTHTQATVEQTERRSDRPALARHRILRRFSDAERDDPGVRPAGAVETILADPRLHHRIFIADGVRRASDGRQGGRWRRRAGNGVIVATDSNVGAGLPRELRFSPWAAPCKSLPATPPSVASRVRRFHGSLAGSALTMDAVSRICRHGSICRKSKFWRWDPPIRPGCSAFRTRERSTSGPMRSRPLGPE